MSSGNMNESLTVAKIKEHQSTEAFPNLPETQSFIPEIIREREAKRPPLKKYIRTVGPPGHQTIVVQVAEEKPNRISITALKEKFGLSESKIGGIIRDAEKLGKIRKAMNGYVWT